MAAIPEALVLLNPAAGGGRARARWARVEQAVREMSAPRIVTMDAHGAWATAVAEAARAGIRLFIAAGGDGTVGALVNALARSPGRPPLDSFVVGAVGLGSSNDFHKPFDQVVAGVPVRLRAGADRRDVGVARFVAPDGTRAEAYFLVSASIGLAAQANARFNDGHRVTGWLKKRWTAGAIQHAALATWARYRNVDARLRVNGRSIPTSLTNLSISKTPFVSGTLRYDTTVPPDDGLLSVHLCERMSRAETLRLMLDLARGRVAGRAGRPGRHRWSARRVGVFLGGPQALELDGEVRLVRRVVLGVLSERVRVCR